MILLLAVAITTPCLAQADRHYRIDMLQVSSVEVLQQAYEGFMEELAKNDIIEGKNLTVNRYIIDADADAGLWDKVKILFRIKKTASKIASSMPDLALTLGTPGTKYGKDKIIKAGIPLVFTAVTRPEAAGCESASYAGTGFTGASHYVDPIKGLKMAKLALPDMKTLGIIHSDDDNAITFAEETRRKASALGITVITKEVGKSDSIKPAARELMAQGVDTFGVPPDVYYALRDCEPANDLLSITKPKKMPIIIFALYGVKGGILFVGGDFKSVGGLSGKQAIKILKQGAKPEDLPIMYPKNVGVLVDLDAAKAIGINLPMEILQIARPIQ